MSRLSLIIKAFFQLGWRKSLRFILYQFLLKIGVYKRLTPLHQRPNMISERLTIPFSLPNKETLQECIEKDGLDSLIIQANQIKHGNVQLFGAGLTSLNLNPGTPLSHWTKHKSNQHNNEDIKFTWEPARFSWATALARAYTLTTDETYTTAFWDYFTQFQTANPVNQGPNWASGQEVGLRLMHWVFCYAIFENSPETTDAHKQAMTKAIAQHAQRIPPTLLYARAQNNNHLLSEAAALYTAALVLPNHPQAKKWRKLGWRWFNWGIAHQIAENGAYMQHSTNYHRLMLQLALWMNFLSTTQADIFPTATQHKLTLATEWLAGMTINNLSTVPNLGANDGAYIFPLTTRPMTDYFPVIQAAQAAFAEASQAPLQEMTLWLVPAPKFKEKTTSTPNKNIKTLIHNKNINSTIYLRTPTFTDRPSHADILHVDLWRNGQPITLDPGTYQYNAAPPWDNALQGTDVHNTVRVNDQHQMQKASRFLWLNWPTTEITMLDTATFPTSITAQHNGYTKQFGITHQRTVTALDNQWLIKDTLFSNKKDQQATARLHWLFPDSDYQLDENELTFKTPIMEITLQVPPDTATTLTLVRAGQILHGAGSPEPHRGWFSPTYAHKVPALSLALETQSPLPLTLTSTFTFPR